ncbi:DUF5655 domain-containing protein [Mucilaginibacter segetis]|uniref:DUF5655 domain-containing protein n=1 Tax=Mucilaginibacter segetis TaxID=2793071 RepID=A0A934PSA1_9SPHI|nr:DUF5655 domain-containing protein [Mucilaginibacter segetis]MBK0378707.1 hypothetical protein [Mucilaginibacter segetis]
MEEYKLSNFLDGKSEHTLALFNHFVNSFNSIGEITVHPAKTMIGIANPHKRIAYITRLGKDFIHVVFPFKKRYEDNLCFQKIAQVPGDVQCNHHFRMLTTADINEEVLSFMLLAYQEEH